MNEMPVERETRQLSMRDWERAVVESVTITTGAPKVGHFEVELHLASGEACRADVGFDDNNDVVADFTVVVAGVLAVSKQQLLKVADLMMTTNKQTHRLKEAVRKQCGGDTTRMAEMLERSISLFSTEESLDLTFGSVKERELFWERVEYVWLQHHPALHLEEVERSEHIKLAMQGRSMKSHMSEDEEEAERAARETFLLQYSYKRRPRHSWAQVSLSEEELAKVTDDLGQGILVVAHDNGLLGDPISEERLLRYKVRGDAGEVILEDLPKPGVSFPKLVCASRMLCRDGGEFGVDDDERVVQSLHLLQSVSAEPRQLSSRLLRATVDNPEMRKRSVCLVFKRVCMDLTCKDEETVRTLTRFFRGQLSILQQAELAALPTPLELASAVTVTIPDAPETVAPSETPECKPFSPTPAGEGVRCTTVLDSVKAPAADTMSRPTVPNTPQAPAAKAMGSPTVLDRLDISPANAIERPTIQHKSEPPQAAPPPTISPQEVSVPTSPTPLENVAIPAPAELDPPTTDPPPAELAPLRTVLPPTEAEAPSNDSLSRSGSMNGTLREMWGPRFLHQQGSEDHLLTGGGGGPTPPDTSGGPHRRASALLTKPVLRLHDKLHKAGHAVSHAGSKVLLLHSNSTTERSDSGLTVEEGTPQNKGGGAGGGQLAGAEIPPLKTRTSHLGGPAGVGLPPIAIDETDEIVAPSSTVTSLVADDSAEGARESGRGKGGRLLSRSRSSSRLPSEEVHRSMFKKPSFLKRKSQASLV